MRILEILFPPLATLWIAKPIEAGLAILAIVVALSSPAPVPPDHLGGLLR